MSLRSWIADLLPHSQSRQKRRRSRIRTESASERLECRALLTAALSLSVNQQPESALSFTSSTNSVATGGVASLDVFASGGWEFLTSAWTSSIQITAQRIGSPYNETRWTLNLSLVDGGNLIPGSYFDTSLDYFSTGSQASLSFKSSNSYYSNFTGSFTVHELDTNASGMVRRFSADFTELESNGTTTRGSLRINPSPFVAENVGATATQLTVGRDGDLSQELVVQLASGDTALAQLPSEVTIAAGESSVTVPIDVIDNTFANNSRRVTFLATANSLKLATKSLVIHDDDGPPALDAVILQDQISESAGNNAATLVLSRNTDPSVALTVTLMSSDPSEVGVPSTVVFPAGNSSILVPLDAKDDAYLDGTQSVSITASADGMKASSATVLVTDDPGDAPPAFTVTVNRSSVKESDGTNAAEVTIRHNVDTDTPVGINLFSSAPERLLPTTTSLAIPAGTREITVKLNAINDLIAFPDADVTITAEFAMYNSYPSYPGQPPGNGSVVVRVSDNDIPSVAVSIDPLGSSFAFDSTPGSWVGQGLQNYYVSTNTGWTITAPSSGDRYQIFSINEILPPGTYYGGNWSLEFAAPFGRTLIPGLFENAARYPFQNSNQPGLTLSGNGRGNNRNSGFFTIVDARYGIDGRPIFFDVTFKQFDEENPNTWTEGELLYRKVPNYDLSETTTREARTITVRRNTPTAEPVTVSLQNLSPDDLQFANSVVIPAGAASVTIPLIVEDNHAIDGNRTVTISGSAAGYVSGNSSALLIDNDIASIIGSENFRQLTSLTEGSETTVSVSLGAQPTSNVVVKVDTGNAGRFEVDKTELIFTPENWSAPQDIIVSAADNPFWDGNVTRSLSLSIVVGNSDPAFRSAATLRRQVTVLDNEPAVPGLSSPVLTLAAHPLLNWNAVPGAESYDLWIDSVTTGTRLYHRAMALTNSYRPEAAFEPGLYRVWIRVAIPGRVSPWSVAREFRVLSQPQLVSTPGLAPAVGRVVWTPVDGISKYEVWINNLGTKTRVYFETNLTTPQTTVPLNLPLGSYAVFVRGLSGNVWTDWSDRLLFSVLEPPVTISSANVANGTLNIAWAAVPGATSYELLIHDVQGKLTIRRGNIPGLSYSSPVPSAAVPLIPGRYAVDVRAWKGSQVLTAAGEGKTIFVVAAPRVSLTPTTIEWATVAATSGYDIWLKKNGATIKEWRNYQSTKISLSSPLPPGQYVVEARSLYPNGSSSPVSTTNLELFRPAIVVSPFPESTVDATPVIAWSSVVWAEKYSVEVVKDGNSVPTFQAEISGTAMLRVSTPLPNGSYKVFVRGLSSDGSRSERGVGQTLRIGAPPTGLTFRNGLLSWNAAVDATNYDLWINYDGVPAKSQIVREELLTSTTYTLPTSLPKGKYTVWVRAKRAEAGSVYEGTWSQKLLFELV